MSKFISHSVPFVALTLCLAVFSLAVRQVGLRDYEQLLLVGSMMFAATIVVTLVLKHG